MWDIATFLKNLIIVPWFSPNCVQIKFDHSLFLFLYFLLTRRENNPPSPSGITTLAIPVMASTFALSHWVLINGTPMLTSSLFYVGSVTSTAILHEKTCQGPRGKTFPSHVFMLVSAYHFFFYRPHILSPSWFYHYVPSG